MARLHLFAEGTTELVFAREVLGPHLWSYGVFLHKPVLIAKARKKRIIHRGGGTAFRPMQSDIERRLKEDHRADVHFTTMIDLYRLYRDFPGRDEADNLRNQPYDRVAYLEHSWSKETNDHRFIPFIQLHEFEAYLYTEVAKFIDFFDNATQGIGNLQNVAGRVSSPELINDGEDTAPSKRIIEQFPTYERLKAAVGPQMAGLIGLQKIRAACPHFDAWVRRLEQLENE